MLGDRVSRALETIGVSKERVSEWLGGPCGCEERQQKFNMLEAWAVMVVRRRLADAREHLERMLA